LKILHRTCLLLWYFRGISDIFPKFHVEMMIFKARIESFSSWDQIPLFSICYIISLLFLSFVFQKVPPTRAKSPKLTRRKSCSDARERDGYCCRMHRHSLDSCNNNDTAKIAPSTPKTAVVTKTKAATKPVRQKPAEETSGGTNITVQTWPTSYSFLFSEGKFRTVICRFLILNLYLKILFYIPLIARDSLSLQTSVLCWWIILPF
jgi:hypothetical protein